MTQGTQTQFASREERLLADAEAQVAAGLEAGTMTAEQGEKFLADVAGALALTEQRSDNTLAAYARSWGQFEAYCTKAGVSALPASPVAVLGFFQWLKERGRLALVDGEWKPTGEPLAPSTIGSYVAAIAKRHIETLAPNPFDDPALRGIAGAWAKQVRKWNEGSEKSDPLVRDQLRQVVDQFDTTDPVTVRDRALAALATPLVDDDGTVIYEGCSAAFLSTLIAWDIAVEKLPDGAVRLTGRSAKGNPKTVTVPAGEAVVLLDAWFALNPSGPIWPGNSTEKRNAAGATAALGRHAITTAIGRGRNAADTDTTGPASARNAAAICLGWWGAMRASEIAGLCFGDITPTPYLNRDGQPRIGLTVFKGESKTDPEGEGFQVSLPERDDDPAICPRRRWDAWVDQARVLLGLAPGEPIPADTPAFFALNRGAVDGEPTPLRPQALSPILRTAAQAAFGRPDNRPLGTVLHRRLSWHGLRRGFATQATDDGVAETRVAAHGGWKDITHVGTYNQPVDPMRTGAAAQVPAAPAQTPAPGTDDLAAEIAALRAEVAALRRQNGG